MLLRSFANRCTGACTFKILQRDGLSEKILHTDKRKSNSQARAAVHRKGTATNISQGLRKGDGNYEGGKPAARNTAIR